MTARRSTVPALRRVPPRAATAAVRGRSSFASALQRARALQRCTGAALRNRRTFSLVFLDFLGERARSRGSRTRSYQQPFGRSGQAVRAANDQPIGGARHGDVKQPAIFVLGFALSAVAAAAARAHVVGLARRPDHRRRPASSSSRGGRGPAGGVIVSARITIGRFEAFGAVHGHDAHFVARDFHVALHLGACVTEPGNETLQRRRLAPLVIQGEIEKLVERIVGLGAEPRQEAMPGAAGAK